MTSGGQDMTGDIAREPVLPRMMRRRAAETPDAIYALFEDGTQWTFADAWREANEAAAILAELGLVQGERLMLWMPNGPDFLRIWMGANLLGGIVAAPNLAYMGQILQHIVTLVEPRIIVAADSLIDRLDPIDCSAASHVISIGKELGAAGKATMRRPADRGGRAVPALPELHPWDTQLIVFTSGTTGPSKGVAVPFAQMHALAQTHYGDRFGPSDRYLLNLPMFHVGGLLIATGAMMTGGSILVVPGFKTGEFWGSVRRWSITGATLIGAAASFLENEPATPDDAGSPLRWTSVFPLVKDPAAFERRFGVKIFTGYGMSELSIPITTRRLADASSCGQLRDDYEAQLVDEHDYPVADGEVGELVVRPRKPWIVSQGYWRDPAATARAWRNGWFHTGDRFRRSTTGDYYFVDRSSDALRRRGENISSQEVENELLVHPEIAEAAVIGVPSVHGEQDVMAVLVRTPGSTVEARAIDAFFEPRMPRFMRPRYIRFVTHLPRNPSLRVLKHELRAEGVTQDTIDLSAAPV
jgi:crotonobetaine/carnitine-CoA ligase